MATTDHEMTGSSAALDVLNHTMRNYLIARVCELAKEEIDNAYQEAMIKLEERVRESVEKYTIEELGRHFSLMTARDVLDVRVRFSDTEKN